MIGLASPSVEMSFEMRFQSLAVESEDVVCGPTPTATFVRSALQPGPGVGSVVAHLCTFGELLFSLPIHFQQTASFGCHTSRPSKQAAISAITLFHPLNKQLFLVSHRF